MVPASPQFWKGRSSDTEIAGYVFRDERLADVALTHGSYLHEHREEPGLEDFERLEFLGDAVVDLIVAEELYTMHPTAGEGDLTHLRAALVSRNAMAAFATTLGLPERARLGRGEMDSGGRGRPGLAARLYESLVGAIYLDGGLAAARAVVLRTMGDALTVGVAGRVKSAKSVLQEWALAKGHALPDYSVVGTSGPDDRRLYEVEARVATSLTRGSGASKREAEEAAARLALAALGL